MGEGAILPFEKVKGSIALKKASSARLRVGPGKALVSSSVEDPWL